MSAHGKKAPVKRVTASAVHRRDQIVAVLRSQRADFYPLAVAQTLDSRIVGWFDQDRTSLMHLKPPEISVLNETSMAAAHHFFKSGAAPAANFDLDQTSPLPSRYRDSHLRGTHDPDRSWSCVPRRVVVHQFLITIDEREGEMIAWAKRLPLLLALLALPIVAQAQSPAPPPTHASAPPPAQNDQQLLKPEQLDALLAPIALFPDALLAQILMASTYPLEVIEAERWVTANKGLKDDALKAAVGKQSWDDSVKSLVATPSVLDMMSDKLDWTQKLGDAVLAQQPDVMDAIQRLRQKAQANDKLSSNQQQRISTEQTNRKTVIIITPTQTNTVYVPYSNPA